MSSITSKTLSDSFPVPDSDLILLFGPHTAISPNNHIRVPQLLIQFLEKAWVLVAENCRVVSFPRGVLNSGSVQILLEPRLDTDSSPLMTSTMAADAVVGILYYMLWHGFFGSKVSLAWPDSRGKRYVVGTIDIKQR